MKKMIKFLLVASILLIGALPVLQEMQPDSPPCNGGGTIDTAPGDMDFCGDLFNSLDDGVSPDGGGASGSGPTPG